MQNWTIDEVTAKIAQESTVLQKIIEQMEQVIIGQKYLTERLLIGLLCSQHLLIEGVPGLAKTLAVTTLAKTMTAQFARIQFTPDLLPADLVGTLIFNPKDQGFTVKKGPLFANLVLADEINRAPAKVQSALLEAMQERQVTIGNETHLLPDPFMVLATQNPIEQEGTYPLPEAQTDRFMMKLRITYPTRDEEIAILRKMAALSVHLKTEPVLDCRDVPRLRDLVDAVYMDPKIQEYIVDIVRATREPLSYKIQAAPFIRFGASPRAVIALTLASKAHALLKGRAYVSPLDVKSVGYDVLRHRVILSYEAEAEEKTSDDVLALIFDSLVVP